MSHRSAPPHRRTRRKMSVRVLKQLMGTSKYEPHTGKKQLRKAKERANGNTEVPDDRT